MIEARELSVGHGGRTVLGPLSGVFGQGVLLVAGPSQSGKSTLLKALCGLVPLQGGEVRIDGIPLTPGSSQLLEARASVGMVFQGDALFDSQDALANVVLPLLRRGVKRAEATERAEEALQQVGLAGHERVLPERLSGGMRKRLGLARAIVARPRYLLADDPFAGLDPGTVEKVRELVMSLWGEKGGLIVATADPTPLWSLAVRREAKVAKLFGEAAA